MSDLTIRDPQALRAAAGSAGDEMQAFCHTWRLTKTNLALLQDFSAALAGLGPMAVEAIAFVVSIGDAMAKALCHEDTAGAAGYPADQAAGFTIEGRLPDEPTALEAERLAEEMQQDAVHQDDL